MVPALRLLLIRQRRGYTVDHVAAALPGLAGPIHIAHHRVITTSSRWQFATRHGGTCLQKVGRRTSPFILVLRTIFFFIGLGPSQLFISPSPGSCLIFVPLFPACPLPLQISLSFHCYLYPIPLGPGPGPLASIHLYFLSSSLLYYTYLGIYPSVYYSTHPIESSIGIFYWPATKQEQAPRTSYYGDS